MDVARDVCGGVDSTEAHGVGFPVFGQTVSVGTESRSRGEDCMDALIDRMAGVAVGGSADGVVVGKGESVEEKQGGLCGGDYDVDVVFAVVVGTVEQGKGGEAAPLYFLVGIVGGEHGLVSPVSASPVGVAAVEILV